MDGVTISQIALDFEMSVAHARDILNAMKITKRPRQRIGMLKYIDKEMTDFNAFVDEYVSLTLSSHATDKEYL